MGVEFGDGIHACKGKGQIRKWNACMRGDVGQIWRGNTCVRADAGSNAENEYMRAKRLERSAEKENTCARSWGWKIVKEK